MARQVRRVGRPSTRTATTRRTTTRRTAEPAEIFVKVARTGGVAQEICLNGNRTIEDALKAAGIDYSGGSRIRVSGQLAELDQELKDGQRVIVSGKIKGGC